jgi:hypothetical protein
MIRPSRHGIVAESGREDHNDIDAKAFPRHALLTRLGCWMLESWSWWKKDLGSSVLDNGQLLPDHPGTPPKLSQMDEHLDASPRIHGPLSVKWCCC